ncbi:hypothetical protein [Fonticella tunisiensis]|uniref:RinA family phage transcriptional activator n=1 Tax=Fonticella tunisiensis TaxID=1096341 RepID=A0A4R7KV86_9CLOT|nr:hypothetical protein [Fonticella tunisiensis]TDT63411.1 hypothetical protein EDD71_102173 [Fonticella tunisiensis]
MDYIRETEKWLYNYKTIKASIENLQRLYAEKEKEVKEGRPIRYDKDKLSPTYAFNSEAENIAIDLATIKSRIERMKAKVEIIETAIEGLNEIEKKIILMKYIEGHHWWRIAYEVRYNERWCRQLKNIALKKLSVAIFGEE